MIDLTFENGTHITWVPGLDGGGSTQYTDFISFLKLKGKRYENGLEWCCGLGAIGYSILDAGICKNMSFTDIYEPAGPLIYSNAESNSVVDRVKFYHADSIGKLPDNLKFDLIVANPPHVPENFNYDGDNADTIYRLTVDTDWAIHSDFFKNVMKYLNSGADIILSEVGTHQKHIELAEQAGLKFIEAFPAPALAIDSKSEAMLMHYSL